MKTVGDGDGWPTNGGEDHLPPRRRQSNEPVSNRSPRHSDEGPIMDIETWEQKLFDAQKIKVRWLCNAVGIGNHSLSLGFCQNQPESVAFIAPDTGLSGLAPLIVRDLYIGEKDGCEEARWCLVLDCPLNHTTFSSYKRSATWKKDMLPKKQNFLNLLKRIGEFEGMLKQEIGKIDWNEDYTTVYKNPPVKLRRAKKHD